MAGYSSGQSLGARVRQTEKQARAIRQAKGAEDMAAYDVWARSLSDEELDAEIARLEEKKRQSERGRSGVSP